VCSSDLVSGVEIGFTLAADIDHAARKTKAGKTESRIFESCRSSESESSDKIFLSSVTLEIAEGNIGIEIERERTFVQLIYLSGIFFGFSKRCPSCIECARSLSRNLECSSLRTCH
jgi:hypothetical protein